MDITTKNTDELKGYFQTGAIPTQEHYAFLIDAGLNQADMGVARTTGEPLSIQAEGIPADTQAVLQFFTQFSDAAPKWGVNMNPSGGTPGFNIHDGSDNSRFFIKESNGNVGVGTMNPTAELEVAGQVKITGGAPGAGKLLTSDADGLASWGEAPGARWEKNNDDTAYYSAGHIGIGTTAPADLLDVNGNLVVRGNLTVEGDQLITNTQTVEVEDNLMLLNKGESGAGITSGEAGLEFDRGTATNYKLIFDEGSDSLKAGETGNLKSLALRQDSPNDTGIAFWNDTEQTLNTDANLIFTSGNLGIGTNAPQKTLHVAGDHYGKGNVSFYANSGDGTSGTAHIQARDTSGTTNIGMRFRTQNAGIVVETMHLSNSGNVGVGSTNPQAKLDVNGNLAIAGTEVINSAGEWVGSPTGLQGPQGPAGASPFLLDGANTYYTAGNMGVGTDSPIARLHVVGYEGAVSTSFVISDGINSALRVGHPSSKVVAIGGNTDHRLDLGGFQNDNSAFSPRMTIATNDNVGIGITNPGAKLEVAGQIKITGGTPGVGKVLTSDAMGLATWEDSSGAGSTTWTSGTGNIHYTSGNVGIATTDPQVELQIGDDTGDRELRIGGAGKFRALSHNTGSVWFQAGTEWASGSATDMIFSGIYGNPIHMAIQSDGNVGIGTSAPTTKLEVAGSFKATSNDSGERRVIMEGPSSGDHRGSGTQAAAGLVYRVETNPAAGGPIFQVRSSGQAIRFFVEHDGWTGSKDNSAWFGGTRLNYFKGQVGIGVTSVSSSYKLYVSGNIYCTGTLYQSSDLRFKRDVHTIDSALEKVLRLRGIQYQWNQEEFTDQNFSEGKQLGLIAQEVESVCPELVNTDAEGYKSVHYNGMVPVLVETIKELHDKDQQQSETIAALRQLVEEMKVAQEQLRALVESGSDSYRNGTIGIGG